MNSCAEKREKLYGFFQLFVPLNCTDNPLQYDFKTSPKNENLLIPVLDSANLFEKPCVKIVREEVKI